MGLLQPFLVIGTLYAGDAAEAQALVQQPAPLSAKTSLSWRECAGIRWRQRCEKEKKPVRSTPSPTRR